MDKKIAGLLGAVAAVTTVTGAHAAAQSPTNAAPALRASSYADLLTPVPNATEALIADNESLARVPAVKAPAGAQVAYYHHHHHHHHRVVIIKRHRRHHYYHHHHHHHHHSGAYIGVPGVGGVVVR
jgi:hypothetical protein